MCKLALSVPYVSLLSLSYYVHNVFRGRSTIPDQILVVGFLLEFGLGFRRANLEFCGQFVSLAVNSLSFADPLAVLGG